MNTSIRFISSFAFLGLGLSGLTGCYGEIAAAEDALHTDDTQPQEQTPADEQAGIEPVQHPEQEPVAPDVIVGEAPLVNVLSLTCVQPNDRDGMDEPMLVINGKQTWLGAGFVAGTSQTVRYESIAFDGMARIELWEVDVWDDFTDPNDLLGYIEIESSAAGDGPQIDVVETRGAQYEIAYQVERCPGCLPGERPPEEP
jgi:hypothetical protein